MKDDNMTVRGKRGGFDIRAYGQFRYHTLRMHVVSKHKGHWHAECCTCRCTRIFGTCFFTKVNNLSAQFAKYDNNGKYFDLFLLFLNVSNTNRIRNFNCLFILPLCCFFRELISFWKQLWKSRVQVLADLSVDSDAKIR